ncbi:hypothetical protein G7047_14660 [Diaphorobacter sp. HDW4A]|uniref:hypothetical protein n=1 Tax=Diaphorobacter sp. HDW4A TaxID=2714924 RepID=UPI0014085993|nr:hypothetical protein [Diaphorobacter sp. HDW4A]QIL80999.1 hypothetical protein G7047_14660 [Diaphorobacter sp. HDW4A]
MKSIYEDEYDALSQMIANSDKSAKELAVYLFPHMKVESGHARLRACLNPEKDERLTFGQIIAAMRFCGKFDPLMYACDETLHARPDRKAAEDQAARIAETIDSATATLNTALKALAQLQARGGIRAVA